MSWQMVSLSEDGAAYDNYVLGMRVIRSTQKELDGKEWLHVSVSREDRKIPNWDDLMLVKKQFIGDDKEAYQVMPRADKHININPGVLHLWCCLEGPALPDFTQGGNSI